MQAVAVASAPLGADPVPLKCPSYHAQVFSAMNRRARGFAWMMWILFSRGILASHVTLVPHFSGRRSLLKGTSGSWLKNGRPKGLDSRQNSLRTKNALVRMTFW
ncbi:hypothetical protein Ddc_15644 [Ditylenchus destructor]|nr:hypothetical protein Ddc_15644 [Ditylenchus destructor]